MSYSTHAPPAIIAPTVEANVDPVRIVIIAKLPDKLIKRTILFNKAEDFSVRRSSEDIGIKVERHARNVLTSLRTANSIIESARSVPARHI